MVPKTANKNDTGNHFFVVNKKGNCVTDSWCAYLHRLLFLFYLVGNIYLSVIFNKCFFAIDSKDIKRIVH